MAICVLCKKVKAKRYCVALEQDICPLCCGRNRLKTIKCPNSCSFLIKGETSQTLKKINTLISETFVTKEDDVFLHPKVVLELATPFESSLCYNFIDKTHISDDDIFDFLTKLYFYSTNELSEINPEREFEFIILELYKEIFNKSTLSDELKSLCLLRILRSIKYISGGAFGNRNYISFTYSKFCDLIQPAEDEDVDDYFEEDDDCDCEDCCGCLDEDNDDVDDN